MTQAQIDLQTQLEQATPTDLITRPLSNDSPVLYIETFEQTPPTFVEPMEHTNVEHENSKPTPSQDDTDHTQTTPPPPKQRYEIMNPSPILIIHKRSDDTDHTQTTPPPPKQRYEIVNSSPIKNAPDKLASVLNNQTLRDMTNLLEPYKRNSSETPITTLTHILHCYDRTHKLLQTLDLDSQRITQSSQAIQSALETITTLFNSTNLH